MATPTRSSGKLSIQFGLVVVPVDVFNGVDEDANKITRNQRSIATGAAVKYLKTDASTGETLSMDEIKYVVPLVREDGEIVDVDLSDEEIDKAMAVTNGTCDLVGFYDVSYLHSYETKAVLQVRPQKVKTGKKVATPHDKPFVLLMNAMKATGTFALLTYVMRGKVHLAGLTNDGVLRDFYWQNEVKDELAMPEVDVDAKMQAMATMIVESHKGDAPPALENESVKAVHAFVAEKAEGHVETTSAPEVPAEAMMDLEALLAASLKVSA